MRYLICLFCLTALMSPAQATIWRVPDDAQTIQAGIDLAVPGDVVEIACGTYLEHDLELRSGITIRSMSGTPDCVIIDAQHIGRVFTHNDIPTIEPTILEGLTITGGEAQIGGGLYIPGNADIELRQCVFEANQCTGNYGEGAGIYRSGNGDLEIVDCVLRNNISSGAASGIYAYGPGESHIDRTMFTNNHADWGACIILTHAGHTLIENSVFRGNSGESCSTLGGDLVLGEYEIKNCTFYDNVTDDGGLVGTGYGGHFLFNNCIFAHNIGTFWTGSDGFVTLSCCNEFGTTEGDWGYGLWGQEHLRGNFSADPCFCDAENGDFQLAANSYCLPGNHPWGCDALVGAFGAGCGEQDCGEPLPVEAMTWGGMKSQYR